MSTSKTVVLKSSNGETFEVEEAAALKSRTIAHMVEDDCIDNRIPLVNVTSVILTKVIEYFKKHVVVPEVDDDSSFSSNDELKNWDTAFIDESTLFQLISAANFLDIKDLLELTCRTVANMIKDKTREEVRTLFNIKSDFTLEEEEEIPAENQWTSE